MQRLLPPSAFFPGVRVGAFQSENSGSTLLGAGGPDPSYAASALLKSLAAG